MNITDITADSTPISRAGARSASDINKAVQAAADRVDFDAVAESFSAASSAAHDAASDLASATEHAASTSMQLANRSARQIVIVARRHPKITTGVVVALAALVVALAVRTSTRHRSGSDGENVTRV